MTQRKRDMLIWLYCLMAAAVCLAICSKSSMLYPINDWTDANAYFSCGKGMLQGRVIYRDLYEHKGPLLYALHALCALIDPTSFLGVYFLETLAVSLFLLAGYRLLQLYNAGKSAWVTLPLLAAAVLSSLSFQQGDSAEELCLPLLAWSLWGMLRWLKTQAPERMSARQLMLHGFLGGCVLWIKFTFLGFYAAWLLGMMLFHLLRREGRYAFRALGWFALGAAAATVPWLVYFGINGAIVPWLKTYLYDNLFLYQDGTVTTLAGHAKAMLRVAWDWFAANWAYSVPMLLALGWLTFRRNGNPSNRVSAAEKAWIWCAFGMLALGVFIGGKSYLYYGLILAAFAPLALVPLCQGLAPLMRLHRLVPLLLAVALSAGSAFLCLAASINTPDLLKPRSQTMQYRFAALVRQTPNATLLNYGFMDAGFYTACNITPSVKYFHQTNVHLQEMLDEQIRYIDESVTDYVVTRGKQPASISVHYDLIATETTPDGFWYDHVYLYKRKGLAP